MLQSYDGDVRRSSFYTQNSRWAESWDEFNDVPIWIHATTNESRYEKPSLRPYPSIPKSLIEPTTGFILSQQDIQQNEADTDSDSSLDTRSVLSRESKGNQDITSYSINFSLDKTPKGRDSELEMAKKRVVELQRAHVRTKYNI